MTVAEMIFDGLVWVIGASVVAYMLKRYWLMFRNRNTQPSGSSEGSCKSCATGCESKKK